MARRPAGPRDRVENRRHAPEDPHDDPFPFLRADLVDARSGDVVGEARIPFRVE